MNRYDAPVSRRADDERSELLTDPDLAVEILDAFRIEVRDKSALCRTFKGSRESFDGVRLFNGEACMDSGGGWWMRKFEEK